jgi:HflK protein
LAAAHVGIAVGGANDITAEAAGVVFLGHSLETLPKLFEVSRRAIRIVWQNIIIFAGVVNAVAIAAAATGKLGPIGAAATHQIASLLVVLNSLRLLRVEGKAGRFSWISSARLQDVSRQLQHLSQHVDPKRWFDHAVARRRELARPAITAAAVLLVLSGFYSLAPNETGVIERFGRKILPYREPGLHYKLPWPMERLTRLRGRNIRVVEIGFRANAASSEAEPAAYEWNVQHRSGRFVRKPEEALMLTGDQNMIEVNAVVHYRLSQPDDFLFQQLDGEATVRTAAESALQSTVFTAPLDDVLTTARQTMEARVVAALQKKLDRYGTGVQVVRVKLLDVHPSLEVVDAFREVSAAFEEKNRLINEAEGYRNEQIALARGNAEAKLQSAAGYKVSRTERAGGDGSRFDLAESAFNTAPAIHRLRLYLETMEQVLPGKKKLILDSSSKGRRHLLLLEDGVEIAPPGVLGSGQ